MYGFYVAIDQIPVGIAYAVWSALGTAIVSCASMFFFGEDYGGLKIICLAFIIVGVAGLNLLES